ncbi:RrF2 family transcriptional regulator [Angustibacter aerolatus]|uniref:HTH-type transcriptional regulator n=1 Tax=Angustibacter aerolatus TaxID=1162965 RepID=A0ABQ6JGC7_9ACTN|nr:Rrf2 family transcriptional regulator [Angustibacter aerolatus]GMA86255.1 putative HTH-type transcriptional regulator [Angustibacter aerolatus]
MRLSAKVDYAVRACLVLAAHEGQWIRADDVAANQDVPAPFLDTILRDLRRGGLVESRRGREGGHRLARPAREVSVADVIRAIDGPLALVRGLRPEALPYPDDAQPVRDLWLRLRAAEREVLDGTTLDALACTHRAMHDADDRAMHEPHP